MKNLHTLCAALAVFVAGLLCGGLGRRSLEGGDATLETPAKAGAPVSRPTDEARGAATESHDFAARLQALALIGSPSKRARAVAHIADQLSASEVRAALSLLKRQSIRGADAIAAQLLARWAELEPAEALKYALSLPSGDNVEGAESVLKAWGARDLPAAEKALADLPEGTVKRFARDALLETIAATDPKRAFATFPPTSLRYEVLFAKWAEKDPADAAAHALLLPPGATRSKVLGAVAAQWAKVDREAALAWAQSCILTSPPGATIERRDPGPLASVLLSWVGEDEGAALGWLQQLPEGTAKTDTLAALSDQVSSDSPALAIEIAALMPPGAAQKAALTKLVQAWSRDDLSGAVSWALEQTNEELRKTLLPRLVTEAARRDPLDALRIAEDAGGKAGALAQTEALRVWAGKAPEAAGEWATTYGASQEDLSSIAFSWAARDSARALAWTETIPAGEARDAALRGGVSMLAQSGTPLAALDWIAAIGTDENRTVAYGWLAWWWMRSDAPRARAWIATAPISEKARADLLERASK